MMDFQRDGAHFIVCHSILEFVITLFGLAFDKFVIALYLIVSICLQTGGETES